VIEDRWASPSTDGLVGMVKVRCEAGCWFTVPEPISNLHSFRAGGA
jgi:hypothetical protein